jgi:hypothetical protein
MSEYDEAVLADLRLGEKAYPIYSVKIRWSEAEKPDTPHNMPSQGLPAGRFWNSTGWDTMKREDCDPEAIKAEIAGDWWPQYAAKKLCEPADLTIEVKYVRRDVWCDGWFSHWTFDVGMSDEHVLASFERYVERIRYSGRTENEIDGILMGAKDRWRWHGCVDGNPLGQRTNPPCRCPSCRANGHIRIDH